MRQKNKPPGKRFVHQVKVTEQEEALLKAKADKLNVTIVRLLVDTALGKSAYMQRKVVSTELFGIRRELQGLATNVNQMARLANSTQEASDLTLVVQEIAALNERIWTEIKALS